MSPLDYVKTFNEFLWNSFLMYALLGVGIFYTVYLGFPQIRHLNLAFKYAFGPVFKKRKPGEKKVNSFQALATAVAAQVGTGNIGGVATAVATGGLGAIFWMWVSALLGMSTIFSEAVLAQKYKKEFHGETVGGSAYYLYYGLGSKWLAVFFSVAIVIALGFVGNMVQANSISIDLTNAFHIPSYIIGIILAAVVAVVVIGGQRRITAIAELLVPFMAVVYIVGSLIIIYMFADQLPSVIRTIFHDAFSLQSAAGGAAGTVMKYAIRYGVARGLFSNEAGMGSTPHAHALADVKDPSEQGFVAMAGVFVDTVLICTSTAFVIMLTGSYHNTALKSVAITQQGFEIAFGEGGIVFLAISLIFFAFTTIIGWYMFAEMNIKFMFGKKGILVYRALVVGFVFLGCLFAADLVWELADTFNGLMVIPNLIGIIFLAPQVKKIYTNFLANRKKKSS